MFRHSKIFIILALYFACNVFAGSNTGKAESPWKFEAGVSAGRPTPLMLLAGLSYKSVVFRTQAFGLHFGGNDFWCGYRGSLLWTLFRDLPFSLDLGFGGGYEFAEAPNGYNKALNKAQGERYVRSYNYKESLDVSAEIWARIFGFYTQIGIPIHYFQKHDEPSILWRIGYIKQF